MLSSQGGCAAKVGPRELNLILGGIECAEEEVGISKLNMGDAGYIQVTEHIALVQSIDMITPISDDPTVFGAIAVEHALSDIYAVGASPVSGMFVLVFPALGLPYEIAQNILNGALERLNASGAKLLKGHTITGKELQFGVGVTGIADPNLVILPGCQLGDALILTKPLGNGIISTALKMVNAGVPVTDFSHTMVQESERVMLQSNAGAAQTIAEMGVHACTDVTGFGLIGHLMEMLDGRDISAELHMDAVPTLPGVDILAANDIIPSGSERNMAYWWKQCQFADDVRYAERIVLFDAQTSGGLLISVRDDKAVALLENLNANGISDAAVIGHICHRELPVCIKR